MTIGNQGTPGWKLLGVASVMASVLGCASSGNRPLATDQATPTPAQQQTGEETPSSRDRLLGFQAVSIDDAPTGKKALINPATSQTATAQTATGQAAIIHSENNRTSLTKEQDDSSRPGFQQIQLAAAEQSTLQSVHNLSVAVEPVASTTAEVRPISASDSEPSPPEQLPLPYEIDAVDSDHRALPTQVPIDLAYALQLTSGQNPQVGFAKQRIQEAYAQLQLAEVLWVPSMRVGANYNKHDGVIQDVAGTMVSNSRSSVYTGFGSQAVGAGSPSVPGLVMDFHLRDAIFAPRIAEQALGAQQQSKRTVTNDVLLETALLYMDLLEATQTLAVAEESLHNAEQLSELTLSFAESGQGLRADADRALTELSVRQIEVRRATENIRVASVRLARVLSQQDQSLTLVPQEPALVPIDLVVPACPLSELIATGLSHRPELAENRYLVGEAVERLRRERYAPLVPSVLLGMSYGGNGGSPNSTITDFGDRVDFDAAVYWEVRNLGFGEKYARKQSQSALEQARWKQMQVMDQVASEVAEAHAKVEARQSQIKFAEAGITAAENSYRRNSERIRDGQGLPIETLQSIHALDQARRQYIRAVADYNRAQFQLQRALGWPIPS